MDKAVKQRTFTAKDSKGLPFKVYAQYSEEGAVYFAMGFSCKSLKELKKKIGGLK